MLVHGSKFRCLSCSSGDFEITTTRWTCIACEQSYSCSSGIPKLFSEAMLGAQDRKLRDRFYDGVFGRFYQFMMPFIVMPVRPLALSWPYWAVFAGFIVGVVGIGAAALLGLATGRFGLAAVSFAVLTLLGFVLVRERYVLHLLLLAVPTKWSLSSRSFKPEETFTAVHARVLAAAKARGERLKILDVSTGSCNSLHRHGWMELDAEYTAIDLSDTMLQQGSRAMSRFGVPVELVLGDAMNLPFQSNSFDLVLSYGAVNGLTDPVKAIGEMARVAKPGGTLLFLDEQLYDGATAVEEAYFQNVLSSHNVVHRCPIGEQSDNLEQIKISQVYHFYYICTACKQSDVTIGLEVARLG